MDAISTAASGMTSALARFDQAAQAVASPGGDDPAQAAVQVAEAKTSFAANVAVVKAADQMTGSLLDILA